MAVMKMEHIDIYALKKNRKKILEALQRKGVVEVEDVSEADSTFTKEVTSQKQAVFLKNSAIADNAVSILNKYSPENGSMLSMFEGRRNVSVEHYYMYVQDRDEIMRVAYDLAEAEKEIAELKAEILRCQSQIEALDVWKTFDIKMSFKGTSTTTAFIGVIPKGLTMEELLLEFAEKEDRKQVVIDAEIVSTSANQTCLFVVCGKADEEQTSDILRRIGFSRPPIVTTDTPIATINHLESEIKKHTEKIEKKTKLILSYTGIRHALMFVSDYYVMRAEKYSVIEKLGHTKNTFVLKGFVPQAEAEQLCKELTEKYDAVVETRETDENEEVPVMLKNNSIVAPVESVLETYSMPNKNEFDPTFVMAIFYYLFFGMMFSDAGYGIIMTGVCAFALLKFKNMEEGLRKSIKMFMFCGISTAFWGFMYGSFFGDAVSVIAKTFFNADVTLPAIWLNPVEGANSMTVLMTCFLFGIIHLFVGLGMKAYMCIRAKRYMDIIYDVVSWYFFVGGGILALLSTDVLKTVTGFVLPSIFLPIGGIMAVIGILIILFFAGRGSSPVKRALKGVYGIYGITSYLSDILSYSRLLALGLATGVIAQVFNQIGTLFGGGILGAILFTAVFIIGHTLNIGINALGAYVHTNRLQFVEFFGKFYEGGGKKFTPFKINTKNYVIKEEIFNG